jgi:hypothetical protein
MKKLYAFAIALAAIAVLFGVAALTTDPSSLDPRQALALHAPLDARLIGLSLVGAGMLDVFKADGFSVTSLTNAVNKMPYVPGRAGEVIDWNEQGIATTTLMIEEQSGTLTLINPTGRGGPGVSVAKDKRKVRNLNVPHIQIDDAIMADEVQGIRAFGQESQVQTVQDLVNMRMQQHLTLKIDPTLEYQRVGAVRGIILNPDGSTLYNLFTEFNVSQPSEVAFDLTNASGGAVRKTCTAIVRTIAAALGGIPFTGVYAFCSDTFWDDLIANVEVRATYLNQAEASQLRAGVAFERFNFGGITFENYRGATTGSTQFVLTDKAHFFPVGVPGFWNTVYAPADYIETVNTIGRPRYAKQIPMDNDKGVRLEVQSNPLSYAVRPNALVQGKRGA